MNLSYRRLAFSLGNPFVVIWTEIHFWIGVLNEVQGLRGVKGVAGFGPAKEAANSRCGFCQEGAQALAFSNVSLFRERPSAGVSASHCEKEYGALFARVGKWLWRMRGVRTVKEYGARFSDCGNRFKFVRKIANVGKAIRAVLGADWVADEVAHFAMRAGQHTHGGAIRVVVGQINPGLDMTVALPFWVRREQGFGPIDVEAGPGTLGVPRSKRPLRTYTKPWW